jgi:hypothetical protein
MKPAYLVLAGAVVFTTLGATALITQGQPPPRAADPELEYLDQRVRTFLERIGFDDVSTAYQGLLENGPLAKKAEELSTLEQKTRTLHVRYGVFRSIEQISARRVGKDVVTMKYLYHCETFPIVWHLTFYRSYKRNETPRENENWQVLSVRFDANVDNLSAL